MGFTFKASTYDNREETDMDAPREFKPLEPGWHKAYIKDVSAKEWDDGGLSLQLTWEIHSEGNSGRLHWQTMGVVHKDTKRELKARYMLADVCNAIGHVDELSWDKDTPPMELIGKGCEIELIILAANPPQYPKAKNWMVGARVPMPEARAATGAIEVPKSATFDDDDIPF
tara:strand:+ start:27 stop:539 length:513 start_codon:yes stop_codon:yes gene_type:complete